MSAVRHLPDHLAAIEIDGRQQPVRRLDEREALYHERIGRCSGSRGTASRRRATGCGSGDRHRTSLRRIGGAAEAGPFPLDERLAGRAHHIAQIRTELLRRLDQTNRRDGRVRRRKHDVCFGSYPAPCQLVRRHADGRAQRPAGDADDRRHEHRPRL